MYILLAGNSESTNRQKEDKKSLIVLPHKDGHF